MLLPQSYTIELSFPNRLLPCVFVGATPIAGGQHLPAGNPAQGFLQEGGAGAGAHQQVPQGELLSQGRRGQEAV